ncbi:hypothetical protein DFP74_4328 [Nocardiopsis sp. Huas11]|uniref:hypothetical protein n=1 Tax=Nocardiopsis sp. Huas11 TaxID=2183912 RepID=UPI000F13A201|nr:hypothetical protein [Nocardiopsis sp. Huas11]RKS08614.1 hypothetical protein DFP74_4328 [Nocardiopsis sp. Huas11]
MPFEATGTRAGHLFGPPAGTRHSGITAGTGRGLAPALGPVLAGLVLVTGCGPGASDDVQTVLTAPADPSGAESPDGAGDPEGPPPPDNLDLAVFEPLESGGTMQELYPVGFSREAEGGVSMVLAYLRAISTNDTVELGGAVAVYHASGQEIDPESAGTEFLTERATDISEEARSASAEFDPRTYPSPGSTHDITPIGVMWRTAGASTVEVYVLAEERIEDGLGLELERTVVHGQAIEWNPVARVRSGDWLVTEELDPSDLGLPDDQRHSLDHPYWTPVTAP